MSDGAQTHGFGLYPGVPSIDFATLMYDDPEGTLITPKVAGDCGAVDEGCLVSRGVRTITGLKAPSKPLLTGILVAFTTPSRVATSDDSGMSFVTVFGAAGD